MILIVGLSGTLAYADGLGGWVNIQNNKTDTYTDGVKTSSAESSNKNLYLKFNSLITPMLSYQMNLRANMQDSDNTDATGVTTTTFRRRLEPAMDFSLRNPMYDFNLGFRRQEEWSAAKLENENRDTSIFYYSRFSLAPRALPSISLHLDRQEEFNYLPRDKDRENDSYSISSTYELPSSDIKLRYNVNVTHNEERTPLSTTVKAINDNFSGNYNVGYYDDYWGGKAYYALNYQGNYAKNKNQQFVSETGSFDRMRTTLDTLISNDITPETDPLTSTSQSRLLSNGEFLNDVTDIKLNSTYQNIGVFIISKEVDSLHVYYKNDGQADPVTWRVYWSNNNLDWNFINESSVTPEDDDEKEAWKYVIDFPAPITASYFKAVNVTTTQVNFSDVEVTEIEAWGTDDFTELHDTDTAVSFTQGLDFNTSVKMNPELNLSFNYSLNRTDQNPVAVSDSIVGAFKNVFSDSVSGDKDNFKSNITRNYGLATTWLTHRLLTTTVRLQRNEHFDNLERTDASKTDDTHSNSYHLSFSSLPIPTLETTLSLIKSDRYIYSDKDSTNHSILFSVGSQLYRDVNMITDLGYTNSKSFSSNTDTSSYSINGSIDAVITRKVSGTMNYAYAKTLSDSGGTSISKEATTSVNYQPGRFINLSGNFRISDSAGDITMSEGILADWLPLPAVRLNISFQHTDTDSSDSVTDNLSGYGIWYLTKFADMRFSYSYARNVEESKTENHNFSTNLNCRF